MITIVNDYCYDNTIMALVMVMTINVNVKCALFVPMRNILYDVDAEIFEF